MFFSRLSLKEDAEKRNVFWSTFRSPYYLHQSVWRLFSEEDVKVRNFLYRLETRFGKPNVYTVSARRPNQENSIWHSEIKTYEPKLVKGIKLAFDLRVNPVRKRDGKRHDVVMDAKWRNRTGTMQPVRLQQTEIVQEECAAWLDARADINGFSVDSVRTDAYQTQKFTKPKLGEQIKISTCDLHGLLIVVDVDSFRRALFQGVGPAKGFGCGLLMVRRV